MRIALSLLLVAAGCGGAQAAEDRSAQATAPVCETLLDAGTVCDPCPGSPRSTQYDPRLADGGFNPVGPISRECDCPARDRSGYPKQTPDGGTYYGPPLGLVWEACTPTFLIDGGIVMEPQPTCAAVLAQYQRDCLSPPLY